MSRAATSTSYRFADLAVISDQPLPELPPVDDGRVADVTITRADRPLPHASGGFQTWITGDDRVRFVRTSSGYLVEFSGWARVLIAADARHVTIEQIGDVSEFQMRHLILHQILPLVISRHGRFVIHASAVSWRDRIIAFVGRTGSGKSTLAAACALLGASLVTDDTLVLDRSSGVWRAIPSYPGLRVGPETLALLAWADSPWEPIVNDSDKVLLTPCGDERTFETRTLPVDRLLLTSVGAGGADVPELRGGAAAIALASQLFRLDVEDASESRRLFDQVLDLAVRVPVSRLRMGLTSEDLAPVARRLLALPA